jgi:PAS domain-containing protein
MDFEQDDESCTCIIYRKDRSHPVKVTEYLSECKRAVKPWQSHPKRMLRHKSLIQCARLAFGYVGIFDLDEAERIIEVNPAPPRTTRQTPADLAEAVTVEFTDEHADILAQLEEVADTGLPNLEVAWSALTADQRTALVPNMRALKQRATAAATGDTDA